MWGGGGELTPNADAGFSTSTVVRPPFEKKMRAGSTPTVRHVFLQGLE